MILSSTRTIR